jgi:signal transduction histidine kinase/ligand-binding sensor domain-containing protein
MPRLLECAAEAPRTAMDNTGRCAAFAAGPRLWAVSAGLACLAWCTVASGLSHDGTIRDLEVTHWGPKEGTPLTVALAQTSDGYLWLGSASGVFRFDGLRYEHIDLPRDERLSSQQVYSLFAPASGGVWIGFTFGGAVFLKDGHTAIYAESDGLPPGSVKTFAQGKDGTMWAGTSSGLARLEGARWHKVGAESNYPDAQSQALMVDSVGTLWTASKNKVLFLPPGEKLFLEAATISSEVLTFGLAESPTGVVWFSNGHELRRLRKNDSPGGRAASSGRSIVFDRDGSMWVALPNGDLQRSVHPENLPATSSIVIGDSADSYSQTENWSHGGGEAELLEDHEGNVWFSNGPSLIRFSERKVTRVQPFKPDREMEFAAYGAALVAADQGALWVGGRTFPLFTLQDGNVRPHDEVGFVSCATRADDGSVWFANANAIWHYASGRFDRSALPSGTEDFEVQAIAQERSGGLWISIVRKGVFRLANGAWTANGGLASLPKLTAITLSSDARGRVWFGYTEGRVAVVDGSEVGVYTDLNRPSIGNVTAIYGKRGRVWAGGEFGLALLEGGRFQAMTPEAGTAFSDITGIVESENGDLWLNAGVGITHITAAAERLAVKQPDYRIHAEIFDTRDGVQGSSARLRPLPSAIEATDGRLWFVRDVGLYSIVPAHIFRNKVPPPVLIQSLNVEGKSYAPVEDLLLPQHTAAVRIDFVGLSLTLPEKVRYRYKLDGVDKDWQAVEGRRQAFYTSLSAGPHRFHVVAANGDGVWNEAGATLNFFIAPTFVQTGWFIALCIGAASVVIWMLIRFRVRRVAASMRGRLEERLAERERIARELHDTLLQSTQGLILRFQAVANRIPPQDPTRDMLDKALDRADQVLAEGRDRVLDLRVPVDTMSDLSRAFAAAGDDLAQGRPVTFRIVVAGTPRDLVRSVKDEAYRIGREALLNAFQHSEAAAIEVQIIYADEDFRVLVRDDGRGIDAGSREAGPHLGHWGMKGMRERAQKIAGVLDVWSRHGAGTEIQLRIPASVAYKERGFLGRWLPFGRFG